MGQNLFTSLFPETGSHSIVLRDDNGRDWTRADLHRLSSRLASALEGLGVRTGDRVAAQAEKSPEAVCLYLACLKCGAIYVPINTGYTASETRHILTDTTAQVFVTETGPASWMADGDVTARTIGLRGPDGLLERAAAAAPDHRTAEVEAEATAAILYTSGTTGRPKGAMISHGNLTFSARALAKTWAITGQDVLLHALPVFHAHGLFIAFNTCLMAGATILFQARFSMDTVVAALPETTVFMGVPTFYTRLLADPRIDRDSCASMRLFVSGSAPLSREIFRAFADRTGHEVLERYGMTETTVIASNPLDGDRIPETVGYPLPGVEVRLDAARSEDGTEIGELLVRGPILFTGYWNLPDKTAAEHTQDGFFRTGDLASIAADGRISLVGRSKDLIISGGYNVYPREVETALEQMDGIAESAVIGVPHADFGEGVVAVIVADPGAARPTEQEILHHLGTDLARYKVPKSCIFVDTLPRNALGKVQKNILRETYADRLR